MEPTFVDLGPGCYWKNIRAKLNHIDMNTHKDTKTRAVSSHILEKIVHSITAVPRIKLIRFRFLQTALHTLPIAVDIDWCGGARAMAPLFLSFAVSWAPPFKFKEGMSLSASSSSYRRVDLDLSAWRGHCCRLGLYLWIHWDRVGGTGSS